jgi:hypothetical protein
MHRFDMLTIGQEQVRNPLIGVANFQPATGELVLGLDYLRDHRVWVSYRTGQLFIQATQPGAMADREIGLSRDPKIASDGKR